MVLVHLLLRQLTSMEELEDVTLEELNDGKGADDDEE